MKFGVWFFLLLSLSPWSAIAEYRVFELRILETNLDDPLAEAQVVRHVTTTLDPFQYVEYYPLNPGETFEYLGSWMCWGSTAHFAPLCPRPPPVEDLVPEDQGPVEEAN